MRRGECAEGNASKSKFGTKSVDISDKVLEKSMRLGSAISLVILYHYAEYGKFMPIFYGRWHFQYNPPLNEKINIEQQFSHSSKEQR